MDHRNIAEINNSLKAVTQDDFQPEQKAAHDKHVQAILARNRERGRVMAGVDDLMDANRRLDFVRMSYAWTYEHGQDVRLVLLDAIYELDKALDDLRELRAKTGRAEIGQWLMALKLFRADLVLEVQALKDKVYQDAREAWRLRGEL